MQVKDRKGVLRTEIVDVGGHSLSHAPVESLPIALRRRLEWAAVLLLLGAALLPRVRDIGSGFDREYDGFQGAFFATCAVNYERLGLFAFGPYPVVDFDLPAEGREAEDHNWYLYANHPPAVPLLAWASLKLFGPEGWQEAWREGQPPEGAEAPLRFPFLLLHMAGLLGLWWAVRGAWGVQRALITLALAAMLPVSIAYAYLVNYENPSIAPLLFGIGFLARYVRAQGPYALPAAALCFALAASVTFAPVFFLPPIGLWLWKRMGFARATKACALLLAACAIPIVLHGLWASSVQESLGMPASRLTDRVELMFAPLFDGTAPFGDWLAFQWRRACDYFGLTFVISACLGLAWSAWDTWRNRRAGSHADLAWVLCSGGCLLLFGFYNHTSDGMGGGDGQVPFLLNLAPGIAVAAGVFVDRLAAPLYKLRAGVAPLVLVIGTIGLPGLARADQLRHAWRAEGPRDNPDLDSGPARPLPKTLGPEFAELLPPGSVALYPNALGLNLATFYYAWRTMLPLEAAAPQATLNRLTGFDGEIWLILPVHPAPGQRAACEALYKLMIESLPQLAEGEPTAQNAHWRAWRLPRD